jgi:hypothetical protein
MLEDPELLLDEIESQSSDCDYSRKDKSLRLLCSRFMLEYSASTEVCENGIDFFVLISLKDAWWS